MPNVEVRDAQGSLLKTYEIIVDDLGSLIKTEFVFDIAKLNAIEDELVTEERADELTFHIAD
jgi:hypothetical protein